MALAAATGALVIAALAAANRAWPSPFSADETNTLRGLSLLTAPVGLRPDASNRFGDDPRAAALGARLFRDVRLSANGGISCATCHQPARAFTDGLPLAQGLGRGTRNTPSIVAVAAGSWFFWDGRRDSQWAQALVPLEGAAEHGAPRGVIAAIIARHYRLEFEAIFGPLPCADRIASLAMPAGPLGSTEVRAAWAALEPEDRAAINRMFSSVGKALAGL